MSDTQKLRSRQLRKLLKELGSEPAPEAASDLMGTPGEAPEVPELEEPEVTEEEIRRRRRRRRRPEDDTPNMPAPILGGY
jgi:hypothetical protein